MKNYYEILGVSENVTKDVLDSVYKKLMEDTSNMSEEKKQEIQEAYHTNIHQKSWYKFFP